jgi:hypothetical protein
LRELERCRRRGLRLVQRIELRRLYVEWKHEWIGGIDVRRRIDQLRRFHVRLVVGGRIERRQRIDVRQQLG